MSYFCALPAVVWNTHTIENDYGVSIAHAVQNALAIEQKLAQGACTEDELRSYKACCTEIEAVATPYLLTPFATIDQFRLTLELHQFPIRLVGAEHAQIVSMLFPRAAPRLRLGAMFFPPDTLARHIVGFQYLAREYGVLHHAVVQRRCNFFQLACEFACGIVELQQPLTIVRHPEELDVLS